MARFWLPGWLIGFLAGVAWAGDYVPWTARGLSIPEPLAGLQGDPARGRAVAADRQRGNCLACHHMPIPEEPDHGDIGPPLDGVGARLGPGELRLRIADEKRVNPDSIMPSFHRDPATLYRVLPSLAGQTILSAQEVEDLVAWLSTLREGP